ncbi:cytochrome b6-f complex subunit PetN [Runella salmonicolor]
MLIFSFSLALLVWGCKGLNLNPLLQILF